ncbi:Signal transduction response regulator, receiver domain protein [Kalmanozyma brasiliensis GHG001]|uniref:histidine kinase n=1 Tax=Kalmanozyma brasiliensis (strain GHG001) TaxID=1365824 RepID=V5GRT6_KALBG|nr:Signal transduction response regulator, receiver domain protein [Kalmanozyma brasiliensis GHG001]EST08627.1 Signal transduction response regulator, receiver domain protein [Kalmanozyma brasiliensis GHG001]
MSGTPHPLQQSLLRPASPGASSIASDLSARKIAANAVEAPTCSIAWGAWLRKYQHGSWCEKVEPESSLDPKQSGSNGSVSNEASTSAESLASTAANSPVPTSSAANGLAQVATHTASPKLPQFAKPTKTHRTVKVDADALMDSMDFYRQNGWLAAPPLPRRQHRKVAEALRRHGLTAAQERDALLLYIKHAKAVFRCEYASFMVESTDDAYMLILAQEGGDAQVQMVPRTVTLCSHAMLLPDDEVLVVSDTKKDWRFRSCPSTLAGTVTNAKGKPMNFYASAPLFLSYNLNGIEARVQVGRLCIMDEQPRDDFDDKDAELLYSIGKMAGDALEVEFQSSKNAKAAEMQQRTSSLVRALEDPSLHAQYRHFNSSSSGSDSGDGFSRYSLVVIDRACQELRECLGAAGVVAFDVSNFRFRRHAAHRGSRTSGTFSKATLPARSFSLEGQALTEPLTPPGDSVSTPTYIDPSSPIISPRMSRQLSSADTALTFETIDLNEGSPPPSILSYSGPESCRPNMPEEIGRLKAVFAASLARKASDTNMNIRCGFHRRSAEIALSSDEEDDEEATPSQPENMDPWAELMPRETQISSYAVCVSYNRAKARPGIMFLVMFEAEVHFDQQERYFVESTMQVAHGSLLRQKLSETDFFQAEFLRHVQHNLRTPLHGALGAVEYLRAAISNDDDEASKVDLSADGVLATLLESISLSGLTLNAYIDDLLSFQNLSGIKTANAPPPKRIAADIVKVIESVADEEWEFAQRLDLQSHHLEIDSLKPQEGPLHGMELIIKASPEVRDCEWMVEVKALQDVVRKVVSNAIRYTRQGYVEIAIRVAAPGALDDLDVEVAEDSTVVEIEVADTGVGMTKDFCTNQLTRPFSKGDSFRDGIGLGMTIVSSTLQKYGGKLSVASEVNLGTRVTMCIPLQRGKALHGRNGSLSSTSAPKLAVSKIAYYGLETRGLRRLANALCEHFVPMEGVELTRDYAEADCIVLPERAANSLDEGEEPLLSLVKPNARFVVISSSHLVMEKGLEKLDGRAVLPMPMPHGPSALRLMEIFLAEEEPPLIHLGNAIRASNQHRVSVTELGVPTGPRRVSAPLKVGSMTSTPVTGAKKVNGVSNGVDVAAVAAESSIEVKPGKSLAPINTAGAALPEDEFRVLVVEDNPINMKLLTTLCKRLNIRYEEAHDGAEAVAKFISFRPSVVLLDISLPIQDGFEACTQMRAHNHPSFIVAVTALSSEEDRTRGIEMCGMDAWMTKPVSPRLLKGDLEEWRKKFHSDIEVGVNGNGIAPGPAVGVAVASA